MRDRTSPGLRSSEMSCVLSACLSRASWSSRSKMLNDAGRPARVASRRSRRAHVAWKVPTHSAVAASGPTRAWTGSRSSPAALFVKVKARTDEAGTSRSARSQATRRTRTRVLPEPAPAMTRSGPSPCVTAASWASFRSNASGMSLRLRPGAEAKRPPVLELRGEREVVARLPPAIQGVGPGDVELEQEEAQVRARPDAGREQEVLGAARAGDRVHLGQAQALVL